jgi:hypothetical protein
MDNPETLETIGINNDAGAKTNITDSHWFKNQKCNVSIKILF